MTGGFWTGGFWTGGFGQKRWSLKFFFLSINMTLVVVLLTPQTSQLLSQPSLGFKANQSPSDEKIAPVLRQVQTRLSQAKTAGQAGQAAQAVAQQFSTPLVKVDSQARLQVYLELSSTDKNTLAALSAYNIDIELVNAQQRLVQAWLPYTQLEAASALDAVQRLRAPDYATVHVGSVTTQGAGILRADVARSSLGVDGSGVRVGVISVGSEGLAAAQASGDLPANVQILSPIPTCDFNLFGIGCAEGTAMLEIVYDLAPGVTLGFCGARTGLEMLFCVLRLADDFNADIIVDDLAFFSEPYFEDGLIARTVAAVVARDVVYTTSAGNLADRHYEATFMGVADRFGQTHDFGAVAGGPSDTTLDILLAPLGEMTIFMQWNDPFGASGNDYGIVLLDAADTVVGVGNLFQNGDDDPFEVIAFTSSENAPTIVRLQVVQFGEEVEDRRFELFMTGDVVLEYQIAAGSVQGHGAVPGVLSTAAVNAADPGSDTVEFFSSRGPATIFFPAFQERQKPDVTTVDGVAVTGAGGFVNPFFGTSAASPHTAGVAALVRHTAPALSATQIRTALSSTATDIEAPGFDPASGAGLLDAVAAVETAEAMTSLPSGILENPLAGSFVSGIGILSGWVCTALQVSLEIDGVPFPAAYGTSREDTLPACGDTDNGFVLVTNWNLFGNGLHTVRLLVDGVALASVTVTVTTLGQEFLTGVSGQFTLAGFPQNGSSVNIRWQQSLQNFVIIGQPGSGGGTNGTPPQVLENPPAGAPVSGAGLISGWVCSARSITIEIDGTPFEAAYGTNREDTRSVCGDANNGFGLLINWNLLGAGVHTVRALADGSEFANVTVVITTFGVEFLSGASGAFVLDNFPQAGQSVTVEWQESGQNFVITSFARSS